MKPDILAGKRKDIQNFAVSTQHAVDRPAAIKAITLPQMEFADDAVEALGSILRAVSEGSITPSEGANVANLVNTYCRAIDIADLKKIN